MAKPERELTDIQLAGVCGGAGLPSVAGVSDIESLAFIVMMNATKSASSDLQSIMDETKQANASKAHLRAVLGKLP